mgnify:CR=1 FL=1
MIKIPISSKVVFFMRSDVFFIISMKGLVFIFRDPGKLFSLDKTSKDSKKEILFSLALLIINLTYWSPMPLLGKLITLSKDKSSL